MIMNLFATFVFLAMQQQVLTQSAAELINKSGHSLLIQTPILLVAIIGLLLALIKFRRFRLVSVLTIFGSLLLFLSSFFGPLTSVWLPFIYAPQPTTMPDGTVVPPSLDALQTSIFYSNLINSAVVAIALLIYLAAIFAGRGKAKKTLAQPDISIPKISIR
jgi:Ca2+/Na+ antiporter